jgi:hypothetical protein
MPRHCSHARDTPPLPWRKTTLLQELAHMHKLNNNNNNNYYYYFVQDLVHPVAPNPTDVTFL